MKKRAARKNLGESLAAYLALTPALDEDALLHTLLECARHVVGAGGAGLTLLDAKKKRLVFRAAVGDGAQGILGQEVPLKDSRHGLAFATGEVQNNTPTYARIEKMAQVKFRNVLVAPLLANGEAVGTISAVNKQGADHFSAQDMEAYRLFADLAAVVVRQRCREEVLRRGIESGAGDEPPATLGAEDRELLAVFEGIARVRQRHPERLAAIGQIVEALGK